MRLRRPLASATLIVLFLFQTSALTLGGDNLGTERAQMKTALNNISKDIEKNFYDPQMKGLDWKALTEQTRQKIDSAQSVSEMMRAMFIFVEKLGDSHTRYLPPSRNVSYVFGFNAKAIGDEIRIYEVKEKTPAQAAGIKVGDRVLLVNGFRADRAMFDTMMWDFRVIRNVPALDLKLQTDNDEPRTIHLEAKKKVEPVMLDWAHDSSDIWNLIRELEKEEKWHFQAFNDDIGYAQVRAFEFEGETFLSGLIERSGAKKALVLDLRGNGGGYEDTLKNFSGYFESTQISMAEAKGRKKDEPILIKPRRPHYEMPMYILIDSETGSAAEMFAKHFQLRKKAIIVGDRSSGRVTRSMFYGGDMGTERVVSYGAQVGVGRVIFPDGTELEQHGVVPDVPCLPTGRDMREERDVCLYKTVAMAREKLGLPQDNTISQGKPTEVAH